MKKLLLALLLLCGLYSNAQIFAPPGAFWMYRDNWVFPQNQFTETFIYTGDTVYNGVNAQKVTQLFFNNTTGITYYFHSDTAAIYYYNSFSNAYKKIYDYSMNVGDSLYLYHQFSSMDPNQWNVCDSGFYANIIGKGIDDINGHNYRYIEYGGVGQYNFSGGKYYEKLGFLNSFFFNDTRCGITDIPYYDCLRLYTDSTSIDTLYDNRIFCPVVTDIDETPTEKFSLYPNPITNGALTIQSQNTVKRIELIDMLGRSVLSAALIGNTVNIGAVAQGIYVAKVTFADGKVGYKRVVVE